MIPNHFFVLPLTEIYFDSIEKREGSMGVWLETWISLKVALSLILVFVGFSLMKINQKADPGAGGNG